MKRILSCLLASVMACLMAVTLFACNAQKPSDKGADGKSAYQIWLDNGHSGTETDFLNWLKGTNGTSGKNGKSAYEIFKEYYPDYKGTEQEWITAVASGDKCSLIGHSYGVGEFTQKPTKDIRGVKVYTCKICKTTKTEVVSQIKAAEILISVEKGKKYVNYGSYPQTHVGNSELVAELNKLTEINENGYYSYNGKEYAKVIAKPDKSFYTDKYGNAMYYTYSDGVKLYVDTIEWFVVEPIKWRVLEENDGSIKVISTVILDTTCYYVNKNYRNIDDVRIAPNNYKYSTLREFLNNDFYNLAFTIEQQSSILVSDVDNSGNTTTSSLNKYACENTLDKVYALSYSEAYLSSYFENNSERQLLATDYALAVGANFWGGDYENFGLWWLRSPFYNHPNYAYRVDGNATYYDFVVDYAHYGISPAMQICIA